MKKLIIGVSVVLGAIIAGIGVGLFLGQPGFGLVTGLGAGLLLWGILVALRK
ncbi:MAG: hypothetical protein WDZ79_01025 [Candidatus Paceibacterota bacterium]